MGLEGLMKTVWIYVDTSKQVGDPEHIKVFATTDAAGKWFEENDPEAWPLSTRCCWNEPDRPQDRLCHACHLGGGASLTPDGKAVGSLHCVLAHGI